MNLGLLFFLPGGSITYKVVSIFYYMLASNMQITSAKYENAMSEYFAKQNFTPFFMRLQSE